MNAPALVADAVTVWQRELLKFVRKPARILMSLITPLIWMGMFGYGMQRGAMINLGPIYEGFDQSYVVWAAPGIVAMGMLFSSIFSGMAIIFDRQFGFLKEILVAPVSRVSFVLGKGLGGMTTSMMQGLVILTVSLLAFRVRFTSPFGPVGGFLLAALVMALLGLAIVNLGIAVAARVESHEVFMLLTNFLVMPMFFLSGAIYPVSPLPLALRSVIYANPVHYAVDAMRYAIFGDVVAEHSLALNLSVLAVAGLVATLVAARLFQRS